jgi:hypothetical protein
MIRATFGQRGSGSSKSHALQLSLESRLRVRTAGTGSTLFTLTWKRVTTPSARLISRLAASARHTSERVCGSWPTPTANDAKGSDYAYANGDHARVVLKLPGVVKLSATADTEQTPMTSAQRTAISAPVSVSLAHWTTPNAVEQSESPAVKDARNLRHRARGKLKGVGGYKLSTQAMLAQREDSGAAASGSGTAMASTELLNQEHSRWLQGYPETWSEYAPTAMPSSRKSRRK